MGKPVEELIVVKLDQLVRLTIIGLTKGVKQREQILLLDRAGFQPKDIAEALGTTSNTVSKELSMLRKARSSGDSKAKRSRKSPN